MAGKGNLYSMMYNELCMDVIEMIMKHLKKPREGYSPERVGMDFRLEYTDGSYDLYFKHRCNILQAIRKMWDKPKRNLNWMEYYINPDEYNMEIYKIKRYYELSYQIYWLEALLIKFNSESAYQWIFNKVDCKNIRKNYKKTKMNFKKANPRIVETNGCYSRITDLKCWNLENYVIPFGKYKTKTIAIAEAEKLYDYLNWMKEKDILKKYPILEFYYYIRNNYFSNHLWSETGYN